MLALPTETRVHRLLRGARARMKSGRISSNVKECKFGLFSSRRPTSNVNNKSVLRSIIYLISLNELFHITRSQLTRSFLGDIHFISSIVILV